jgi:S1-C subfamily serine protease
LRVYTRTQVALISSICVLAAVLLTIGIYGSLPTTRRQEGEIPRFTLEGNPLQESFIPARDAAGYNEDERENIDVYARLNEAVVNITTETLGLTWFFEPVPQEGGSGSGSIIDARGYVLTNYHVVQNANKVFVTLADGTEFEGEVIGKDPENDLAIIQFDPGDHEIVTIPFGDSENLRVGQKVLAIGNPFAFQRTLTTGIISGLGRPVRGSGRFVIQDMIQTDASINPGNSGGPLLNSRGELIGVNTVIYSPSGGSIGIGFAIPVSTARRAVPELIAYGSVRRGWIDIVPVQLQSRLVRYADLPIDRGVLVSQVIGGGNADKAGLRGGQRSQPLRWGREIIYLGGDIIVGIGDESVEAISDLFGALETSKPGDAIEVTVIRNRREITLEIVLAERPDNLYE